MALPLGWVRISSQDPPLRVVARMGEERPNVESGYGGWAEVARPRRAPITTFTAPPALRMTVPLLLDGWAAGRSVERDIQALERMGLPTAADGEPPRVRVAARGSALPYQSRTWVIDSLEWGDALMNDAGDRVRQAVAVSLLEYVEDVHLQERSASGRRRAKAKARKPRRGAATKRISVKARAGRKQASGLLTTTSDFGAGEDLLTIAARELGDADRWVEIAKLNGLRDPRAIRPGQVLRLP